MAHRRHHIVDPAIRDLRHSLAAAKDSHVVRIVNVIDNLPERGGIDTLVATVRPRLARLRPARPLRFARLLFIPLDPVIVPPKRWRRGMPAIPRTALASLAATVRAGMGNRVDAIDMLIAGRTTADTDIVAAAGARLWPDAAAILQQAPPPIGWDDTGLNLAIYAPLARMAATVLAQTEALDRLAAEASATPPAPEVVMTILRAASTMNRDALPLLMVVLLSRVPTAITALMQMSGSAGQDDGTVRQALDQASDTLLDQLQTDGALDTRVAQAELGDAAGTVRRMGSLLREMEAVRATPAGRTRLQAIRRRLDHACRTRFGDGLTRDFLTPLVALPDAATDADVAALEEVARGLRALETEARAIGSANLYDRLLAHAADAIRATPTSDKLDLADKARLLEIMADSDAAWAMFEAGAEPDLASA